MCYDPLLGGLEEPNGPGSSVGIETGYGLDGPGIESRWRARFSAPIQTGPGAHPTSCTMGTGSFPGVKSGRGVTLTPHPLLVPWSWKGRAVPLLPLRAVRPVQSLSVCTRVTFTFTFRRNKERSSKCLILSFKHCQFLVQGKPFTYSFYLNSSFVDAFAKLLRATISFFNSVGLHGTTQLTLDGFSWNWVFEYFWKSGRENSSFTLKSDKNNGRFSW